MQSADQQDSTRIAAHYTQANRTRWNSDDDLSSNTRPQKLPSSRACHPANTFTGSTSLLPHAGGTFPPQCKPDQLSLSVGVPHSLCSRVLRLAFAALDDAHGKALI
ncbi:hypothetical protein E2C01_026390 [Portunus trituberculatus]|uniref:Uncharacterized protein n=1 Tax=Portunus trituberculatus TaxID=210409 RepID=A0A5B7EFJ0_PORTR|nr:hypothetical protein [Portunus trituberculatus]